MNICLKRWLSVLLLALLLVAATTAVMPALAATVKTTSVALDKKGTVTINIGTTLDLTATVKPDNSTQGVRWTSSKRSVATVTSSGKVTARKAGITTITAKSGVRKAKVRVKVVDPYLPSSVKLDKAGTIRIPIYSTLSLNATLYPSTAQSALSWKSSSKKVATVSNGVVTAKKAGTARITVTTRNKKKATVKVKVYDPYLPTSVRLDKTGTIKLPINTTLTLTPTLSPSTAQSGLTWKSSSKKVATVKDGVVTGKKIGTTTIMVTTRNKKKAKVKVKVYDPYLPSSVKLSKSGTVTLTIKQSLNLTAALSPTTAQSNLTWKSSKGGVAHVSSTGVVTALNTGTTTITVTTRNKKTAKVKIKVKESNDEPITTPAGYSSPYVIYVSKKTHTVAILGRDSSGAWSRVIHKYPTGLGVHNSTIVGTFQITGKERWHSWGSTYSPYANKLSCGIFLHGPIYSAKNFNSLKVSPYNHIGTDTSSGCIRTICGCAGWVYYNCPVGTQVIIRDNSRFSEPRQKKLSSNATSDPTDFGSDPEILITSFKASPSAITLEQGKSQAITLSDIEPYNNSTNNQFTYTSANKAVATVSSSGVVMGVGQGSTTITIVANDVFQATVKVPVTVSGGIIAGDESVTTEKLLEDETAKAPADETTPATESEVPAEETATDATGETEAVGETEAAAETEAANETEATGETEPIEATSEVTASAEEEIISGTDVELTPETETIEEDNGLTIETEDLSEEQSEIIVLEEE